ncbi:L-xylulose reductase-like protein [Hapsidospora chrysogenum ATCC 11550]|uniref:L-xylulose reductase-like protein n=1 Tax=Hapsidospora chrysogenum (strain ATCC 11550 / CBS 779.69 / DSM 880 / IAM 14645 / JCM 23072 / IMI 49137) TaxID=857340 RepID=A0A086T2C6_HAPC1|nr:L-xylulose reductase-like protein [Hapsidospora chrysogenum ATCC 11550]
MAFNSRLVIIAGGIGGIGSAIGKLFRAQGARLALLYAPFEEESVGPTLEEVYGSRNHTDIATYACDITSPQSVQDAFDAIAAANTAFPAFLVNSAGYVNLSPLTETTPEDTLRHYMINLYGPTLTSQAFARLYLEAKAGRPDAPGGRIVHIGSQAAHVALDKHGAYCASKAGLLGLTRCQANEWGPEGITANTVSPGPVWTALGKKAWADDKVRGEYLWAVPTGQFAEPDEVANIVSFLCQDSSKNINGADMRLDGGYTAR